MRKYPHENVSRGVSQKTKGGEIAPAVRWVVGGDKEKKRCCGAKKVQRGSWVNHQMEGLEGRGEGSWSRKNPIKRRERGHQGHRRFLEGETPRSAPAHSCIPSMRNPKDNNTN